jgi:hypothetical protein
LGWQFRNAQNTGPNDGSVNEPQQLREFIFSPEIGRGIDDYGAGVTHEAIEKVRSFGRGWLFLESYVLTPPHSGTRAAFESVKFRLCLTWPV